MATTTTQVHLLGVFCEIEIDYNISPADEDVGVGEGLELNSVYILGIYPEGMDSPAVKRREYVYLNAKADLDYLTLEEYNTIESTCYAHDQKVLAEAWDR